MNPVIISASRSTDIPAFYSKWFINRLKAGYCNWINPFNQKSIRVDFDELKAVVFWSKNINPLIPYLSELDKRNIKYYFQFTLNDYERENLEPNVPKLTERINTFKLLHELKYKVIWRYDPLLLLPNLSVRDLLTRIWIIGNQIKGCTDKLVFSFIDVNNYKKVKCNLLHDTKLSDYNFEFNNDQKIEFIEGLIKCRDKWKSDGWDLKLATCAEDIDLSQYGIEHNKCIDGDLLKSLCVPGLDDEFIEYLDKNRLTKDKGQRKLCGCIASKDIGMYNTCRHFCSYCYANHSKSKVISNYNKINENSESLVI